MGAEIQANDTVDACRNQIFEEFEITELAIQNQWAPYISVTDAVKLDQVREALRKGGLYTASQLSHVFRLLPIAA